MHSCFAVGLSGFHGSHFIDGKTENLRGEEICPVGADSDPLWFPGLHSCLHPIPSEKCLPISPWLFIALRVKSAVVFTAHKPCMTCPIPSLPPLPCSFSPLHSLCSSLTGLLLVPPIHQDRSYAQTSAQTTLSARAIFPQCLRLASHLSGHFSIRPSLPHPFHLPPTYHPSFVCLFHSLSID